MKVYIITREPFPNGMAATNRIKSYAKALIYAGVQCEVIIFTRTEVYGRVPKNILSKGFFEDIPFQYIGETPLRARNVLIRKFNDIRDRINFKIFLLNNLKQNDVVIGYCSVYISFINDIIDIVHKKKAKYIRELCELPFGTSKETKKTIRLRKKTLKYQFPKCDGFIVISDALFNVARKYKSLQAKIIKIPILVDYEKYDIPDLSDESDVPYIFHSGTLYEQKDGILGMIEAFGMAIKKTSFPIRFILTGKKEDSPYLTEINNLIVKYQLGEHILFTGYLSDAELRRYLSKASLVIINKYCTQQNEYCFSTKLAEYLAAGKPVIITKVGEAMNWLVDNESAYFVEPENISLLSDKIVSVFLNEKQRKKIAQCGKLFCQKNFDYHDYGTKMLNFFNSI